MTNQNFSNSRERPDLFDEREDEDILEEEQDISAELYPAPPNFTLPNHEEKSNGQEIGMTSDLNSTKASGAWVDDREVSNDTSKIETPLSASRDTSDAELSWPGFDDWQGLQTNWNEIQRAFVDNPREAVQQAEALVSTVVEKTTMLIANEKKSLESVWKQDKDPSTEELRQVIQRYRSIFNHLTSKS